MAFNYQFIKAKITKVPNISYQCYSVIHSYTKFIAEKDKIIIMLEIFKFNCTSECFFIPDHP